MNASHDAYLWDPSAEPDPEIVKLERMLRRYSADALDLEQRELPLAPLSLRVRQHRWRWCRWHFATLAAAATVAGIVVSFEHRLSWTENSPWPVTVMNGGGSTQSALLHVGEDVRTKAGQTASLSVARIGKVDIGENSAVALVQTRSTKHRLELKYGRLHARIWAPPGHFGVANRDDLALDLGCEFDIETSASGIGTLAVTSGWVIYRRGSTEVLVPEAHSILLATETVGTPVRLAASNDFRDLVARFDTLLATPGGDSAEALALAEQVAATADNEDRITLLSLLTRYRELRASAIHRRLVSIFGEPTEGDSLNEWWAQLPKQPKRWWLNWRDAL